MLARILEGAAELVAAAINTIFAQPTGAEVTGQQIGSNRASEKPQKGAEEP